MTNDILGVCDRRRSLKKRREEGPLAIQNYNQVNQAIRRKMKQVLKSVTGSVTDFKKLIVESEQGTARWLLPP